VVFNRFPTIFPHGALGAEIPPLERQVSCLGNMGQVRQRHQPELLFISPIQPCDMVSSESERDARMDFLILCHSTHDILAHLREMVLTA
jgi:hypothetical protein